MIFRTDNKHKNQLNIIGRYGLDIVKILLEMLSPIEQLFWIIEDRFNWEVIILELDVNSDIRVDASIINGVHEERLFWIFVFVLVRGQSLWFALTYLTLYVW